MLPTYPSIPAGTSPQALLLQHMLELIAYKSGNQSVTSSTTLVNDNALFLPLEANATYKVELLLYYTGGTAGSSDIKYDFTGPSGVTFAPLRELGLTTGLAVQYLTVPAGGAFGSNGPSNKMCAEVKFTLTTSGTPGTLQFQWAQNSNNATATTVLAGSELTAKRRA